MEKLKFYNVINDYIVSLQEAELSTRGFTRVPNLDYGKFSNRKFVCGIVLKLSDINYFAPVTSFKIQKPDNFLIKDKKGNIVSSLRFNYMFPVPDSVISVKDFSAEKDYKYRQLLQIELKYCQNNQSEIMRLAKRTYQRVMIGKNIGLVHNSCDFKLLEQKCLEYEMNLQQASSSTPTNEPILPNQLPDMGSQGFSGQGFGGLS